MAGVKLIIGVMSTLLVVIAAKENPVITDEKYPGFKSEITYQPKHCDIYKAKKGDTMYQDYIGTLVDGTKFDDSYHRRHTFNFKLLTGAVIVGMDLGMKGMCKGEKRTVTIPPEIGYGARGIKNLIPGNATLIFEVVLVDLEVNEISQEIITPMNCTHNAHVNDTVTIKKSGWTLDGNQFEMEKKETFVLGNKKEILGIEIGLKGMCVGEKKRVTIPGEKAFRKKGREGVKAWNSVIYEIELLKLDQPE